MVRLRKRRNKFYIRRILLILLVVVYIAFSEEINSSFGLTDEDAKKLDKNNTKEVVNLDDDVKVYYLDVGQADAMLIDSGGEYMVIDGGNNNDGPLLVKYFEELGIKKIKYVVGTHAHEDHIGGLDDIITNFDIETVYIPDAITTTKTFEDLLDAIDKKNMTYRVPKIGSTFKLRNAIFKVIYTGTDTRDLNNTSIVLKMIYGNNTFLFTGDATGGTEKKILDKDVEAEVLKVGHHGSKYSSTSDFLKKVNPKYAIISAGDNNNYDHPSSVTLDSFKKLNVKIYRTDEDGTIIASSDGNNIKFETIKTDING